jgi:hypothetical protein
MRSSIYVVAVLIGLVGAVDQAGAMPIDRFMPLAATTDVEQAQFFFGGRHYCWYDRGWHGPGFYWCGYAWHRGVGWGGPVGWRGWHRGGPGRAVVRPRPGRPAAVRPGRPGGRPSMGAPGRRPGAGAGGRPGGGRPGGGGRGGSGGGRGGGSRGGGHR